MSAGDYAEKLRQARTKPHAVFHKFVLLLGQAGGEKFFLFFEGNDDGAFYMPYVRESIRERELVPMVCEGRTEVLKACSLVDVDGRGTTCTLFFIDKDHSDYLGEKRPHHARVFETAYYAIENYLVCEEAITAFWTEILHLEWADERKEHFLELFRTIYPIFCRRMRLLMALVLVGRGAVPSFSARKLNLNNANLENLFEIDFDSGKCKLRRDAGIRFCIATNILQKGDVNIWHQLRSAFRDCLDGEQPKKYIRGKYELWFFAKFLQHMVKKLSAKDVSRAAKRATPNVTITSGNAVSLLSSKVRCPAELRAILGAFGGELALAG